MCTEMLWEIFLQQAYFKNGKEDVRIKLRRNIGKYVITGNSRTNSGFCPVADIVYLHFQIYVF